MAATDEPKPYPRRRLALEYRIPLDPYETLAVLVLPRDLTLAEAQKLFAVMKTLVKEE